MRLERPLLSALPVAALLLSTALAGVDVAAGGSLKAKGTLAPGEEESFTVEGVEGTLLTASVKGDRKSGLDPSLRLVNPDTEEELVLGPPELVDGGSTVSLRNLPLPSTGRWTLIVAGEGSGGYALSLKTKHPKSASATFEAAPGGEEVVEFGAPRGASVSVTAKAAPGSAAVPRLTGLEPAGADAIDLSAEGKIGPTSHAVSLLLPGDGGDHSLYLTNAGETSGAVTVAVKIKSPKAKKQKYDLRGDVLGSAGGGGTFVARLVGSDGGTVEGDDSLDGAVLEIPSGALASDVTISMASAEAPPPPTGDDQAAGPAVDLQPSGLLFDEPALLTLPFDPALIPADRDASDLRILVVEGNGETFEILPEFVNGESGTVTFPINGFSVCIPVIRSGIAPLGVSPGGDEYWNLTLEYEMTPDEGGNDSRARSFLLEVGETSFFGDGTVQTSSTWRTMDFTNASAGEGIDPGLQLFENSQEYAANWSYGEDGRTIRIEEGDGGPTLAVSRDGSVLLENAEDAGDPGTGWSLLLRKHAGPVTEASLEGTWFLGGFELSVDIDGFSNPASMDLQRMFGTAQFDGAGSVAFALTDRYAEIDSADGSLSQGMESDKGTATYEAQEDGTILVTMPPHEGDEEGDVLRIYPGRNADVMFLVDAPPCGSCVYAMVLVRQGSGLSPAILDGTYAGSVLGHDLESYAPDGGGPGTDAFAGDASYTVLDFSAVFDGDATASLDGGEHVVRRETTAPGGVESIIEPFVTPLGVAVDSKGKLTLSPTGQPNLVVGGVAPDGMFAFFVTNPSLADGDFALGFMLKGPPAGD